MSQQGAGAVHHVAFRTPDADYDAWAERLNELDIPNSGKVDRFWFRSLYVREPNGVLFEIASDGPGFGVDEDQATLGEKVVLPPFLEPQREAHCRQPEGDRLSAHPHEHQPVLSVGPPLARARLGAILIHGRGASAEDILGIAAELEIPDITYLAPQAAGHTWYPYSFLSPIAQNEPGLELGPAGD